MTTLQENRNVFVTDNDSPIGLPLSQLVLKSNSNTLDSIFSHSQPLSSMNTHISERIGCSVYLTKKNLLQKFCNKTRAAKSSNSSNKKYLNPMKKKLYRGIRQRQWGKWVAEIRLPQNRMRVWLGTYHTAEAAAYALDTEAYKLHGEYTCLNFPNFQDPTRIGLGDGVRGNKHHQRARITIL